MRSWKAEQHRAMESLIRKRVFAMFHYDSTLVPCRIGAKPRAVVCSNYFQLSLNNSNEGNAFSSLKSSRMTIFLNE